ncbi:MAG: porin family protein [Rhodopseudomonas sp.]|uniref:outer membrane protein n=1 Tax=Rhodopseudomonas sp. TaxID=1078 RepID=UPI0018076C07|nr:outer membrane beta-barrel protein [Rhodopseudomonas sp.]NVN87929.1 porin family protein [Rhodopseudomonas sp.]
MRSVKFLVAAGAASLLSSVAFAADMPSIAAPPPQYYAPAPVDDFGGWYLRGDIGLTNSDAKLHNNLYDRLPPNTTLAHLGHGFDGGTSYGLGAGYQFNSWFRADVTGEYRSQVSFHGSDYLTFTPGGVLGDTYHGGYKSWVGLVNLYADLGTWWCITPFVGVGAGGAHIQTAGFTDNGVANGNYGSYFAEGASKTNFAWAAHAGLAYKVSNNFTVELAYRYLDMGSAGQGFGRSYDGTNAGMSSFQFKDLTSHDLKIGVRWTCCELPAAAPPPLIRKG